MITREERSKRFSELPEKFQELYSSPIASAFNAEMSEKYSLTPEQHGSFMEMTGDVILGFYKTAELLPILQKQLKLEPDLTKKLVADCIDYLGPVLEREAAETEAKKAEMTNLANKIAAIPPAEAAEPQPAVSTDQSVPTSLPTQQPPSAANQQSVPTPEPAKPIHTMEADMNRAHGYGYSTQQNTSEADEPVVQATPQDKLRPNSQ